MEFDREVARVAYELYVKSGRIEGHDLENWLEAEKIVLSGTTNFWNEGVQSESAKRSTSASEPVSSTPPAESSGTATPKTKKSPRKNSRESKRTRS